MRSGIYRLWAGAALALGCASGARAGETIAYGYDELGRLVKVEHSGTVNDGVKAQYSYDQTDNRTNVTVTGVPTVAGGGFETPEQGSGYTHRPTGSPATFTGNSGVAGNNSDWGFAAAPEGDQVGFLQGGPTPATIALPVSGLTPGVSYRFSFRISGRPGWGYWPIPVTLSYEGATLASLTPAPTGFVAATSAAFTAGAASGTLFFTASGTPYDASAIDLVTIAPAGGN
jgi:hypothetical protein